jgi:hypothetical protein
MTEALQGQITHEGDTIDVLVRPASVGGCKGKGNGAHLKVMDTPPGKGHKSAMQEPKFVHDQEFHGAEVWLRCGHLVHLDICCRAKQVVSGLPMQFSN